MKNQFQTSKMKLYINIFFIALFLIFYLLGCGSNQDKGWKTYRHDGARSGVTNDRLNSNLSLKWIYKPTHAPVAAWYNPSEELPRMHSDKAYHVAASDGVVYFGSSVDNKLYALDISTGKVKWTFFTEGPIRFAPTIWKGYVFFGSDDGHVYCLKANKGKFIWKYRAGPSDKKVLGNERMISLWPVRTSVLVEDGITYFGAGVFPYEGIYICALNAKNGKVVWKNDTIGDKAYELQFGGISPHGYLLASENILYVPSGRTMPAAFDRKSGEFLYTLNPGSKVGGTWGLIDDGRLIAGVERSGTPAKVAYEIETGHRKGDAFAAFAGIDMVATSEISFVLTEIGINAINRQQYPIIKNKIDSVCKELNETNSLLSKIARTSLEAKKNTNKEFEDLIQKLDELKTEENNLKKSTTKWQYSKAELNTIILANNKVIAGGKGKVIVLDAEKGDEIWNYEIEDNVLGLAVSDGCLLICCDTGNIYCFGVKHPSKSENKEPPTVTSPDKNDELTAVYEAAADHILNQTGVKKGYCLVLNSGVGRLALELAKKSDLKIIGIEQDKEKVKLAKENLDKAKLYGSRIIVENWQIEGLPDYFANLIVSDDIIFSGKVDSEPDEMFRVLKPLGGVIYFGQPANVNEKFTSIDIDPFLKWMKQSPAPEPVVSQKNGTWIKSVRGKLEGAGAWTHQYSNIENTACSDDKLVNYPFGVLWFGEPGPEKMIERHAHAASPVAMNGRLFIQGENVIMAYDSYNGIKLWERNIPGANRVRVGVDGGNLALSDKGIFVATGENCLLLDSATGKTLHKYKIPASPNGKSRRWGYIACSGTTLFGSAAMPLNQDYNQLWQLVTCKEGENETQQTSISSFFSSQFDSKEEAKTAFQRDGTKWRFIADFPAWSGGIVTQEPATDKLMYSDAIFAMDIETGRIKWIHRGKKIAHITISIGNGKMYFADNAVTIAQNKRAINERLKYNEQGICENYQEPIKSKDEDVRLVIVLDAETGHKKWERAVDLSGCGGDAVASAYKNNTLLFFGSFGLHDKWRFPAGELKWHRITALSSINGNMLWSRPLNYMVRPVIIDDTIIVEPRACDLRTGKIKTRVHPITGKIVPWEYYRPGHTCAITSATATCLFYRSYNTAFCDLSGDRGITYFGAIRPGCWINMIPANGLLFFPEASSGCTCSFPLRTTVVLKPEKSQQAADWTVFISQGPITPVKRLGINLGAPGDKKDEKGNIWFGYPRPKTNYGIKFDIHENIKENMGYFCYDARGVNIDGTDIPWLFTSGCIGFSKCEIPLIDDTWGEKPGIYTVRMGFFAPSGKRVFDIKLQENTLLENFNLTEAGGKNKHVVIKEFNNIKVENDLKIELIANNSTAKIEQAPTINFIEIIREDVSTIAETENEPVKHFLNKNKINSILKSADKELDGKNIEKALELYHRVFDAATSLKIKQKALNGMAVIGSQKSLNRIKKYTRNAVPILWDYKEPDAEFIDSAVSVYVSIANNLINTKPEQAKKMLFYAKSLAKGFGLRNQILNSLVNLGIAIDDIAVKQGFITRWHFTGPFPWDRDKNKLDKFWVQEPNINLSEIINIGDKKLKWQKRVNEVGMVDLNKIFGPEKNAAIYAYAEIKLAQKQDLKLKIGSNDGFKCWFNDHDLGTYDYSRGWKVDEDVFNVKGKKGINKILLKISQEGSAWAFSVRLTDLNNVPVVCGYK